MAGRAFQERDRRPTRGALCGRDIFTADHNAEPRRIAARQAAEVRALLAAVRLELAAEHGA